MRTSEPTAELDGRFSSPEARPMEWAAAREHLAGAQVYWLSTVRPDGRPHVTPLLSVWLEGALYFCTGPAERKARNLGGNRQVVLTTGGNALDEGLDVVVEGVAVQVGEDDRLQRVADAYEAKYGPRWHFDVSDGAFEGEGGRAVVYEVAPAKVLAFGRNGGYSQTRWRFAAP